METIRRKTLNSFPEVKQIRIESLSDY